MFNDARGVYDRGVNDRGDDDDDDVHDLKKLKFIKL